jgi:replicative superfamily II helicase
MRIVMLSAVLPNVEQIAKWINAKFGISSWRPIDLEVGFALFGDGRKRSSSSNGSRTDKNNDILNSLIPNPKQILVRYGSLADIDKIMALLRPDDKKSSSSSTPYDDNNTTTLKNNNIINNNCYYYYKDILDKFLPKEQRAEQVDDPLWFLSEQVLQDHDGQVLIFTTDRKSTEIIATRLALQMSNSKNFRKYFSEINEQSIQAGYTSKVTSAQSNEEMSKKLLAVLKKGVAFHHAGLDSQKRKFIENAYKERLIKIIVSTTTLIAGVNLPATLVIFDSLLFWNGINHEPMLKRDFLNGCGRAGRPGYETRGRALFIASSADSALKFISKPLEDVKSQFKLDTLIFQTLAFIKRNSDAGRSFTSVEEVQNFFAHSFYSTCNFTIDVDNYLRQLLSMGMIAYRAHDDNNDIDNNNNNKKSRNNDAKKSIVPLMMITTTHDFRITKLGYETIRFYLQPKTGYLISQMVQAIRARLSNAATAIFTPKETFNLKFAMPKKVTPFSIIHALMHSKEMQNLLRITNSIEDEEMFAEQHYKEILVNREMFFLQEISDDERRCLSTAMAFYAKLNMEDIEYKENFEYLYQKFSRNDFVFMQEIMQWLLGASLNIAKVVVVASSSSVHDRENSGSSNGGDGELKAILDLLTTLNERIDNGMVKEELLELCRVREVGRIRSLFLSRTGITSLSQLIEPKNRQLILKVVGGSEQITNRIIANAKSII